MKMNLSNRDATLALEVRGAAGAPPVLVVGPGPGFPLLQEVPRIERALGLDAWHAAYLEQRGCGTSPPAAQSVAGSIDDVAAATRWLAKRAGRPVTVLGMSMGASYAVAAAARDATAFQAIVGLGLDVDIPAADVRAHGFVVHRATARGDRRALAAADRFVAPVVTRKAFQLRAKWVTELGGMQRGTRWGRVVRQTFVDLVRGYGTIGALRALGAMNRVQDAFLPELARFTLHDVRRLDVPVALVHGAGDAVSPPELVREWLDRLAAPSKSLDVLEGVGHVPHVEAPAAVRRRLEGYFFGVASIRAAAGESAR